MSRLFRLFSCRTASLVIAWLILFSSFAFAADRKVKTKISPTYPEIARKNKVSGAVKLEIVIAANGTVKSVKALGGHPMLIEAAASAVMRWKYEPGEESTDVVEVKFTLGE